jgi:hypothetical protein
LILLAVLVEVLVEKISRVETSELREVDLLTSPTPINSTRVVSPSPDTMIIGLVAWLLEMDPEVEVMEVLVADPNLRAESATITPRFLRQVRPTAFLN